MYLYFRLFLLYFYVSRGREFIMAESIYTKIINNIQDGRLAPDFSLFDTAYSRDPFVFDGARDAITFLHERKAKIALTQLEKYKHIFAEIRKGEIAEVWDELVEALSIDGTVKLLDFLMDEVKLTRDSFYYYDLLDRAVRSLKASSNVELIKFSLLLLEHEANNLDGEEKSTVRTLALAEELTLFASVVITHWPHGQDELFDLAKKVQGWGRIMLIPRLNMEDMDVNRWLLAEGYKNVAKPQYQATVILTYSKIADIALNHSLTAEEFSAYTNIISNSLAFEPGIVRLIDVNTKDQLKIMQGWLKEFAKHELSFESIKLFIQTHGAYRTILQFIEEQDPDDLMTKMDDDPDKLIVNFKWMQFFLVKEDLVDLVDEFDLLFDLQEFREYVIKLGPKHEFEFNLMFGRVKIDDSLEDDIRDEPFEYLELLKSLITMPPPYDKYLEEVLDIYASMLPLVDIANGPDTPRTHEELNHAEELLVGILNIIRFSKVDGREFLIAALQSSSSSLRLSALFSLRTRAKFTEEKFSDLDPELDKLLNILIDYEPKNNIKIYQHELINYN